MFTGIVQGCYPVTAVDKQQGLIQFSVELPESIIAGLTVGANVAVDGVGLATVAIDGCRVSFQDAEEIQRSTLSTVVPGRCVNIERSATFGSEISGHIVSGHIMGTARIVKAEFTENYQVLTLECPSCWMKYILTQGFIALDGVSLTVVDAHRGGRFTVPLAPEILQATTFGYKGQGDDVNLEVDPHTQIIVETVERLVADNPSRQHQ